MVPPRPVCVDRGSARVYRIVISVDIPLVNAVTATGQAATILDFDDPVLQVFVPSVFPATPRADSRARWDNVRCHMSFSCSEGLYLLALRVGADLPWGTLGALCPHDVRCLQGS